MYEYGNLGPSTQPLLDVYSTSSHHPKLPHHTASSPPNRSSLLFTLPPELRAQIYTYTFTPSHTSIQIIPYFRHLSTCKLNLPLSLYLVCRQIYPELPPLPTILRALHHIYLIDGNRISAAYHCSDGPKGDDDPDLRRFKRVLEVAERIRLVGARHVPNYPALSRRRRTTQFSTYRQLSAGEGGCALKVLEVQPITWSKGRVARALVMCFTALTACEDAVRRGLEVRLVRNEDGDPDRVGEAKLDMIEEWLRYYQGLDAEGRRRLEEVTGVGISNENKGRMLALGRENE